MRTDKEIELLAKFLEQKSAEGLSLDELNDIDTLLPEFMDYQNNLINDPYRTPCADDYIDKADNAKSKKKKLEYLNKALELEPDNMDAMADIIDIRYDDFLLRLNAYAELVKKGHRLMKEGGYLKEFTGGLWYCLEARPFLRVKYDYFTQLMDCGMIRAAIAEGKELLKLCEDDNLGVRYYMMHLYAYMEDENAAKKLFLKYDREENAEILLPLAILYFKINKFDIAKKYLREVNNINKGLKEFITTLNHDGIECLIKKMDPSSFEIGGIDELLITFMNNTYLYGSLTTFYDWAENIINVKKKNIRKF